MSMKQLTAQSKLKVGANPTSISNNSLFEVESSTDTTKFTITKAGLIGIGTSSPDTSAILDIQSKTKGVLFPKMTSTERAAISNPPLGLLVFQTDGTAGLYYYTGGSWVQLVPSTGAASNVSGTVAVSNGGTGSTTLSSNAVLLGNGTSALQTVSPGTSGNVLTSNGTTWVSQAASGGGGGVTSVGAINGSSTANGASITSGVLNLHPADGTNGGVVTTSAQTFAGNKTFSGTINGLIIGTRSVGTDNISYGVGSFPSLTSGQQFNVAIGNYSLASLTSGSNNIAIGRSSQYNIATASNNTSLGNGAMYGNTSGSGNTAIGASAMYSNSGSNNTVIGYNASIASGVSNATALGYNTTVDASDKVRIGNTTVTVIEGQVSFTAASDRRLKENIRPTSYGLSTILALNPVNYILKSNGLKQVGLIAQEVKEIIPEVVNGKEGDIEKGEILGITYANIVPILAKAIQEQQAIINELKQQILSLSTEVSTIKNLISK